MAHEGPPIHWDVFYEAGEEGRLVELLGTLPRGRWAERDEYGNTLLHHACLGPNAAAVVALVQSGLVNARDKWGTTPTHYASRCQPRLMEVLCAAGADLRTRNDGGYAPIDRALQNADKDCVRVLVANGVRLSTVREGNRPYITPELEAFERGVLRCRAGVMAMLRVKRAGKLWMWDKFLLAEMAVCTWATRYDKGWQN